MGACLYLNLNAKTPPYYPFPPCEIYAEFNFQGIMFGYATDETDEAMPLTLVLSHKLNAKLHELRRNGILPWVRPDSKSQVTIEYAYEMGACVPKRVSASVSIELR